MTMRFECNLDTDGYKYSLHWEAVAIWEGQKRDLEEAGLKCWATSLLCFVQIYQLHHKSNPATISLIYPAAVRTCEMCVCAKIQFKDWLGHRFIYTQQQNTTARFLSLCILQL